MQPKRLGLLAYLLAAAPGSLHRRDALAALFWPELDAQRARNALSQIIHHLRKVLGDAVITRGAGEVGIDPNRVACDAVELDQALKQGHNERALELYQGDFLKGFHLNGSSEFEHWLDSHRDWLRTRVAEAAWSLAADRADEPSYALAAAKRAFALAGGPDEAAMRKLLLAYGATGDLAGGVREYERFERELASEYDASPSAQTREVFENLRSTTSPRRALFRRLLAVPDLSTSMSLLPGRRPRAVRVIVAIFAMLAFLTTVRAVVPSRERPETKRRVAVAEFSYQGAADHAYLGESVSRLLSTGISESEIARITDARDAEILVSGDIVEINNHLQITAKVVDRGNERTARHFVEGAADSAFALVSLLSAQVLSASSPATADILNIAERTTKSPGALKSFIKGEAAYRLGNYGVAVAELNSAVAQDSSFAVAYYRLSRAASWTGEYNLSMWAAERAEAKRMNLLPREQIKIEAWLLMRRGYVKEAREIYRRVVMENGSEIEAVQDLADLDFHWGSSIGIPPDETLKLWERVLALDAANADALVHLLRILARTRDLHGFEARTEQLERLSPGTDRLFEARLLHAFAFGTAEQRAVAARDARNVDRPVMVATTQLAASVTDHPRDVASLLVPAIYAHGSFSSREAGHMMLQASLAFAAGQVTKAFAVVDSVDALDPVRAQEFRAVLAAIPFPRVATEHLRRARRALAGEPPATVRHKFMVPARLYLAGLLDVRMGDAAAARRSIDQLKALTGEPDCVAYATLYARILTAELLRAEGKRKEALAALGAPGHLPDHRLPYIWSYGKAEERFLRAELLRETGKLEEALRWYSTFPDVSGYDLAYVPAARLQEARLRESMGDRDGAAVAYLRFVSLWSAPEAQYRFITEDAKGSYRHLAR